MNDDAALLALEDIREPTIGELPAQVAEVKWLLLWFLPFVLGWFKLIPHYLILDAGLGEGFGLEEQDAGDDCDEDGDDDGDSEKHEYLCSN